MVINKMYSHQGNKSAVYINQNISKLRNEEKLFVVNFPTAIFLKPAIPIFIPFLHSNVPVLHMENICCEIKETSIFILFICELSVS